MALSITTGSNGSDRVSYNLRADPAVMLDLGNGSDTVNFLSARSGDGQIRLTFTSSEVGNGNANDSGGLANQDGGLAVRVQAEDSTGALVGPISRFDDEGITFRTDGSARFDVRDLVSGVARGDQFDVVTLGTSSGDRFTVGGGENYYINGGAGDDAIVTGTGNDFLVGGAGDDTLTGGTGNDSFIGGGGNDDIFGGAGDDTYIFNVTTDGRDRADLGLGDDTVLVTAPAGGQVRLTFTSAEVGNGNFRETNTMANQDGGRAVRLQAEGAGDTLTGPISRIDDEGITFRTANDATFDVRDLVSGTARGDQFDVVTLGTSSGDTIDETGETERYYLNGGAGNDTITGGGNNDFLVGGAGNDRLEGGAGSDNYIGGGGSDTFVIGAGDGDRILDFVSGTDKIDLSAFGIDASDIQATTSGGSTVVDVDSDGDGEFDTQFTLVNVVSPMMTDYVF